MTAEQYLQEKFTALLASKEIELEDSISINLETPKNPEHGDLATNIAMLLAGRLKKNPRVIAQELLNELELDSQIISAAEIAGAGFINFRLSEGYYQRALRDILGENEAFGHSKWGQGRRFQIEFVSANPTGPLNVVSARAASVGDVLGNLLRAVGFDCDKEYYVNDAGRQVRLLGRSVSARYMESLRQDEPFPDEGYHGDYVRDIANEIIEEAGEQYVKLSPEERWQIFSEKALQRIMVAQREVLEHFGLHFDSWFRESGLRSENAHFQVLDRLTDGGHVYEKDGAKWFRSSEFGDEKDRVLMTSEDEPTYFLVDIAYHVTKYERGFVRLLDLWGPDHHGYIPRMKAALLALGYPADSFEVKIIQQVNLMRGGEVVKMSKRAGKIIEMKELLDEVGVDVARFFFLARRNESPLDFDMDLAVNASEENPVYYVQYAHARICNIIRHAAEQGIALSPAADLQCLVAPEEITLIKKLLDFPDTVSKAAKYLEAHRVPNYLQELAGTFHRFYHHHRVVTDDALLTSARLVLVEATRIVLNNALRLIGVTAPERM